MHITDTVTELSIIHYNISFELFTGRRTVFKSARSSGWDDVLLRLFGLKTYKGMSRLEKQGQGWTLRGMIGDPLSTRSSSDRIFLFVNDRAVSSRVLSGALRDAYRNIISLGKSPVAVLSLQIDPQQLDVNVHPAKREIRLLHESEIASAITASAAVALEEHARLGERKTEAASAEVQEGRTISRDAAALQTTIAESPVQRTLSVGPEPALPEQHHPVIRIVGQIKKLYIVAEGEDGLVIIDQHAAAERIRFELLVERYKDKKIRQELVEPISVELSASERLMMNAWQETLQEIGFDLSPFGGNTYTVRAVPALGSRLENAEAVHDILRDLFASGKVSPASTDRDEILKLLACRGSIKSGKELTLKEMEQLLHDLQECSNPTTCPHGRPVMVILDQSQLERLFGRR